MINPLETLTAELMRIRINCGECSTYMYLEKVFKPKLLSFNVYTIEYIYWPKRVYYQFCLSIHRQYQTFPTSIARVTCPCRK